MNGCKLQSLIYAMAKFLNSCQGGTVVSTASVSQELFSKVLYFTGMNGLRVADSDFMFHFYDTGNHTCSTFFMHTNFKPVMKYPSLDHRYCWCMKMFWNFVLNSVMYTIYSACWLHNYADVYYMCSYLIIIWVCKIIGVSYLRFTWGVQVVRYPNFFLGNGSR